MKRNSQLQIIVNTYSTGLPRADQCLVSMNAKAAVCMAACVAVILVNGARRSAANLSVT